MRLATRSLARPFSKSWERLDMSSKCRYMRFSVPTWLAAWVTCIGRLNLYLHFTLLEKLWICTWTITWIFAMNKSLQRRTLEALISLERSGIEIYKLRTIRSISVLKMFSNNSRPRWSVFYISLRNPKKDATKRDHSNRPMCSQKYPWP